MAKFREVLKNKNFFFLWLGQIISQFGDRLNQMALIGLIYARAPGSTWQLAKVLSFTIVPVFLVGPAACSYVDRWDRRRTMAVCDFTRAFLVVLVAVLSLRLNRLWPIYIMIFLVFSISRFFVPAKMAIIPELVKQDRLLLANSLSSTTGMIAVVAGLALGGLVVERAGSTAGFLLDALTYLISGIFIFMIAAKRRTPFYQKVQLAETAVKKKLLRKTIFADIREGWQYLLSDEDVRFVTLMFFLLGASAGAISVVIIVFIQQTFGSVTRDLGILSMFLGIGLLCGALFYGRFGEHLPRKKTIFFSLGALGIIFSSFIISLQLFSSSLVCAVVLSLLLGVSLAPIIVSAFTLIHEVTEEKMRGRIFGSLEIVGHLGFIIFMFLSSFLAERIGRFWILLSVGVILAVIGMGAIVCGRQPKDVQVNSRVR